MVVPSGVMAHEPTERSKGASVTILRLVIDGQSKRTRRALL